MTWGRVERDSLEIREAWWILILASPWILIIGDWKKKIPRKSDLNCTGAIYKQRWTRQIYGNFKLSDESRAVEIRDWYIRGFVVWILKKAIPSSYTQISLRAHTTPASHCSRKRMFSILNKIVSQGSADSLCSLIIARSLMK